MRSKLGEESKTRKKKVEIWRILLMRRASWQNKKDPFIRGVFPCTPPTATGWSI